MSSLKNRRYKQYLNIEVEKTLIDLNVPYKKSGNDFIVRCVSGLHVDKHPSLRIDQKTGIFHCPACGFGSRNGIARYVSKLIGLSEEQTEQKLVKK